MAMIKLGYARADITPIESVPLAGFGNSSVRMHTNVMDPLYATCLAFEDESGSKALIYSIDLCNFGTTFADHIRDELCAATGITADRILASCTHNHSSPAVGNTKKASIPPYITYLKDRMIAAAKEAMADRKPTTAQIGRTHVQGLNHVRRYVLADGTYAGDNYGHPKESPFSHHESTVDNCLQLVKFIREGGKDVVIANFQMHPHRTGGARKYDVSSDVVGAFREAYEEKTDCHFAYFSGGSGNVNGHSRIPLEDATSDYKAHGQALAECATRVTFREAQLGQLKVAAKVLDLEVNHDKDHLLPQAKEISKVWAETHDYYACRPLLDKYGFNSVYQADALIQRAQLPATYSLPMWTVSIGDLAFVGAPYEMFDTNGQRIKDASPFRMTFVLTCTNESHSYMPSRLGFAHGGYSVDKCRFKPGIGELLAENFIELLESIY